MKKKQILRELDVYSKIKDHYDLPSIQDVVEFRVVMSFIAGFAVGC